MAIRVTSGLGDSHTGYDPGDDVRLRSYRAPAVASIQGLGEGELGVWDDEALDPENPFGPTEPPAFSPTFSREPSFNVTTSPPAMPIRQVATIAPAPTALMADNGVPPAIAVEPAKPGMSMGAMLAIGAAIIGIAWLAGR